MAVRLSSELNKILLEVEGHVPQCSIAEDANALDAFELIAEFYKHPISFKTPGYRPALGSFPSYRRPADADDNLRTLRPTD